MLRLVRPSAKYKRSFIAAELEFRRVDGRAYIDGRVGLAGDDLNRAFANYLRTYRDYELGRNLPAGRVQASKYWLVEGSRYIGEVGLRHKLTPALRKEGGHIGYAIRPSARRKGYGIKICALALKKAKAIGIKRALLTCKDSNIGSWKIIEANGGKLHSKIRYRDQLKRRYWVST